LLVRTNPKKHLRKLYFLISLVDHLAHQFALTKNFVRGLSLNEGIATILAFVAVPFFKFIYLSQPYGGIGATHIGMPYGRKIAELSFNIYDSELSSSKVKANAKLIAAAPDLLEALEKISEVLDRTACDKSFELTEQAIKKATT
jgi:hypothetical protein